MNKKLKPNKVEAKVIEIHGGCSQHKVGDRILFEGTSFKGKICPEALVSIYPSVHGLMYGAVYPWSKEGISFSACPDKGKVVFQLKIIETNEQILTCRHYENGLCTLMNKDCPASGYPLNEKCFILYSF